jgi:hypothetical protein
MRWITALYIGLGVVVGVIVVGALTGAAVAAWLADQFVQAGLPL